jgi:ParB-like chromosome segregation protein Spo0J
LIADQQFHPKFPVADICPHPNNAKKHNLDAIARSINENGFYGAVLIQKSTGQILAGEGRYRAAIGEGLDALPVFVLDVDDDQARRILLADNRTQELGGGYDNEKLLRLLEAARNVDQLHGTGWQPKDLDKVLKLAGDAVTAASRQRADAAQPVDPSESAANESSDSSDSRCPHCKQKL